MPAFALQHWSLGDKNYFRYTDKFWGKETQTRYFAFEINKDSQVLYFWSTFICTCLFSIQLYVLKSSLALLIVQLKTSCFYFIQDSLVAQRVSPQCRTPGFNSQVGKIPWRRKPTPLLLPGKYGQRSLVGYSPWDRKESHTTEQIPFDFNLPQSLSFFNLFYLLQKKFCIETKTLIHSYKFIFNNVRAQLVKNPPATQETLVWFLGREDSLEKG